METLTRILHIGDRDEYREIGTLLSDVHHRDYQLIDVSGAKSPIEAIAAADFDVILLDYHWGDRDGAAKSLIADAIAEGCKAPILVMTDEMEADVDREAIQVGASDYLIKGRIDSQLLERTIRYAIERKLAEKKLARLAHYDPLTNIPNRTLFRDRLEHAIHLAERGQLAFTLMYIDLNGFKAVNDTYGHETGDKLLASCADRLCDCMRRSDSVARIGGDEFTILLEHPIASADIARIASKIISAIEEPHVVDGLNLYIGCSIGIAVYPEAGRDADLLQRNADMAMYRAKQKEGSNFQFFTEAMNVEAHKHILLESDLYRAVEHREFSLVYLPQVNLADNKVAGYEAQLRWYHPARGWLDAAEFSVHAEATGLVVPLGHWAFQQICKDLLHLKSEGAVMPQVSLALSHRHLNDYKLLQEIREQALLFGKDRNKIEFTIDEKVAINSADVIRDFCKAIQQCGFRLAITNFAKELSSLKLLRELPVQRIELAPSITENYRDEADQELIALIISIAHKLGRIISARNVKSLHHATVLKRLGCPLVSGEGLRAHITAREIFAAPKLVEMQ